MRAKEGDRNALESVVRAVPAGRVPCSAALLWHPQDAEDATQEILIRVITGLGGFRGDSGFRHLGLQGCLQYVAEPCAKQRMEQRSMSFEEFARI